MRLDSLCGLIVFFEMVISDFGSIGLNLAKLSFNISSKTIDFVGSIILLQLSFFQIHL